MHFRFLFLLLLTTPAFSQGEKKILFRGDSVWYSGEGNLFFISRDKGIKWDTIFSKPKTGQPVFFYGAFDTATNIYISGQRIIFIFGWDGTMHNRTILFCSSDYGKTWNKSVLYSFNGAVGVKYLYHNSSSVYFLYLRNGYYAYSEDAGKTWENKSMVTTKFGCFDDKFKVVNGILQIGYSRDKACKKRSVLYSSDGGKTWSR